MAKYVPDVKTQRWVIISPGRISRPDDFAKKDRACPFCAGNESLTPPEVYRIGPGDADSPGWLIRVVPNKFPITDIHEVIIHSPDEACDVEHLPLEQVTNVLTAYRDRYLAHEDDGQVLIFCNHGEHAGASLKHPHSQLAVIPKQISLDTLVREPIANVVTDNTSFVTYCPDFSQWPFEVWIAPKNDTQKFGETPDEQLKDLAAILQHTLQKLEQVGMKQGEFVYNYYIYHGEKWYMRITPRFIHRAGFELGTGLNVNIVDPVEAARILKEVELP